VEHNDATIECLDRLSATAQSLCEIQLHQHVQIAASPCENVMLLLVQDDDNVAWLQTNFLVALPIESL
jgi:hypothetical protein